MLTEVQQELVEAQLRGPAQALRTALGVDVVERSKITPRPRAALTREALAADPKIRPLLRAFNGEITDPCGVPSVVSIVPTLRADRTLHTGIPLDPTAYFHPLRRESPRLVRWLHRFY